MKKVTDIKQLKPQIIAYAYSGFAGMDDEYKALVAEHHKIKSQLGVYTQEYINEHSLKQWLPSPLYAVDIQIRLTGCWTR